jgi:hypothetical protein
MLQVCATRREETRSDAIRRPIRRRRLEKTMARRKYGGRHSSARCARSSAPTNALDHRETPSREPRH